MPQSFVASHLHVVFGTKGHLPLLRADVQPRLYEYIGGIARGQGSALIAAGGISNHVHLLVSLSKEISVAAAARDIKANSSKWIHETYPGMGKFQWQVGYGAFSVSQSNLEGVKRYIASQEEHHRRVTFRAEFVALLQRHGLPYDERYL